MLRRKRHDTRDVADGGPARVLVVNDDEGACELLVRLLSADGYHVDRALSAGQATASLGVVRPHVVVLDLATGGIGSNLKLLDTVRGHQDLEIASCRVVLVTAQGHNRIFSWQAGVDGFIERPFHVRELRRTVAEALARPEDERARHRREQIDAARTMGRRLHMDPRVTQEF